MLIPKTRQESYKVRNIREDIAYDNLPETRLIVVKDGFSPFVGTSSISVHGSPSPYERTTTLQRD